jgi:hypothetical protein
MAEATDATAPRLRAAGPVRITLPAKIAYDPKALKNSIAEVVERLGCPRCFSGADCLFEMERSFVINPAGKLDASAHAAGVFNRPDPEPAVSYRATVAVARPVKYELEKVYAAIDRVIDLIGPHPCISGFDVFFRDEIIVINEQLQGHRF